VGGRLLAPRGGKGGMGMGLGWWRSRKICRKENFKLKRDPSAARKGKGQRKAPAPRTPSGRGQRAGGRRFEIRKEQDAEKNRPKRPTLCKDGEEWGHPKNSRKNDRKHLPFADSAKSGAPEKSEASSEFNGWPLALLTFLIIRLNVVYRTRL
jgi:hypothetical protein